MALISKNDEILYTYYAPSKGDPLSVIKEQLLKLYELMGDRITICGSAVTGYGEELLKNAFMVDIGIVKTVAHLRGSGIRSAGRFITRDRRQDMKCFKLRNGRIDR